MCVILMNLGAVKLGNPQTNLMLKKCETISSTITNPLMVELQGKLIFLTVSIALHIAKFLHSFILQLAEKDTIKFISFSDFVHHKL